MTTTATKSAIPESLAQTDWLLNLSPRPDARLRLICAHHAGGSAQYFESWVECLDPDCELIAVNLPGRGARRGESPIRNLGQVVQPLVDALIAYTDRPYAMFGDSIGALLSFEVIRELRRRSAPLPLRLFASGMVAPHITWWNPDSLLHKLPDDKLFQGLVRDAGMLDEETLANEELQKIMTPVLRADLEIAETYPYVDQPTFGLPITAIRGDQDILLTPEQLEGWSQHTNQGFEHLTFPGAHFYSRDNRHELLNLINERLKDDLENYPMSILKGESVDVPQRCLHELFSEQAQRTPDAIALAQWDKQYTYTELDTVTDHLARWLINQGVKPGDLVGILMSRCVDHVVALIAINKAGAAFMPLETSYPQDMLQQFADASGAKIFLSQSDIIDNLSENIRQKHQWVALDSDWHKQLIDGNIRANTKPLPAIDPGDMAFLSMSSGTSGAPKGICQSHRACVNAFWHRYLKAPYDDNEQEACHVYFIWYVWLPLLQGGTAWMVPADVIYDPARLAGFIREHGIARSTISPSLLERVLRAPNLDLTKDLATLKNITIIGEVVPSSLVVEFLNLFPDCTFTHSYGCAETHDAVSIAFTTVNPCPSDERVAIIGMPQVNQYLYVLDSHGQPLPRGVPGEVFVGGDSISLGYFNDPQNTAARFVPDPVLDNGERLFKTGDRGRVTQDGQLQIFGRLDSMVKLRGYSVMLGVVEGALLEHPSITNAVVVVAMDETSGRPDHLNAYVVVTSGSIDDNWASDLREFLVSRLPHYAMPAHVVPLDMLPVDARSNSKVDRQALPPAGPAHRLLTRETVPPRNSRDQAIAELWCRVLDLESVGIHDNFFALGGHSLLAAELSGKLNQALETDLHVATILEYPTIAQISDLLAGYEPPI